jgi:tryptophanyl-tRNA synthetase
MARDVILTGLRANAEFHLGNYLGAILPMVNLQKKHAGEHQLNMFVPDLHSFISPIDHGDLYKQTMDNLRLFVAAGLLIDDGSTFIYRQSYIPAHSELAWILNCFTGFGELSRMTEFKDKTANIGEDRVTVGLFDYPPLMAADILLYGAKYVPVGEDQRQHIEYTRDVAMRMNNKFGDLFVLPADNIEQLKFSGRDNPVRIRSLRNPDKKMSKSIEDPAGTIMLSDKPDAAAEKIISATTDSVGVINYDFEDQPGISNLLQMLALLSDQSQTEINTQWVGKSSYGELKTAVADTVKDFLSRLQANLAKVDDRALIKKLEADEVEMTKVANATLLKVQKAVGLRPTA